MQNNTNDKNFESKLVLLQEILNKKFNALNFILSISENQEQLYLSSPSDTRRDFLSEMAKEKQKQIDEVLTCDAVFQSIFDGIAEEFVEKGRIYSEQMQAIQTLIKKVLELDIKIRAQEEKSRLTLKQNIEQPAVAIKSTNKNYILEQYRKQSKPSHASAKEEK